MLKFSATLLQIGKLQSGDGHYKVADLWLFGSGYNMFIPIWAEAYFPCKQNYSYIHGLVLMGDLSSINLSTHSYTFFNPHYY